MHTCSNCGTEFDTKYLQCPNCGCTRGDIKNAEHHDKRTEKIGATIAIVFVIFLIGLITYGGYLLMNPFKSGPITSNDISTTTTTTTETTSTTTTTTQVVGTTINFDKHTIVLPEGFYKTEGYLNFTPLSMYNFGDNYIWITNNTASYLLSIMDKTSFKMTEDTEEQQGTRSIINWELANQGYSEIKSGRFSGRSCYYATKYVDENTSTVLLFYNRNTYLVTSSFNIAGHELNDNNTKELLKIIATIQ